VEPPAKATCANCGAALEANAEFCPNCGARVPTASPLASLSQSTARTSGSALGLAAGVIFGFLVGAIVSAFVGSLSMTVALSSKRATLAVSLGLLALDALLVVLIVSVARRKTGSSATLNSFLVTFAVVCGGGLALCSGIGFFTVFGK
jgi:hypothetical protein